MWLKAIAIWGEPKPSADTFELRNHEDVTVNTGLKGRELKLT